METKRRRSCKVYFALPFRWDKHWQSKLCDYLVGEGHMRMECPEAREDVVISKLGPEIMVCDPGTDRLHILNTTASFIWDMADGKHSPGEIADAIQEAFTISPEIAVVGDVSDVLMKLRQKGLLKEVKNGEGETKKTGV